MLSGFSPLIYEPSLFSGSAYFWANFYSISFSFWLSSSTFYMSSSCISWKLLPSTSAVAYKVAWWKSLLYSSFDIDLSYLARSFFELCFFYFLFLASSSPSRSALAQTFVFTFSTCYIIFSFSSSISLPVFWYPGRAAGTGFSANDVYSGYYCSCSSLFVSNDGNYAYDAGYWLSFWLLLFDYSG